MSQVRPGTHWNSLEVSQGCTHTPLLQTNPAVGQVTLSSTCPLQSLSTPSHTSVAGMTACRQVVVVPPPRTP